MKQTYFSWYVEDQVPLLKNHFRKAKDNTEKRVIKKYIYSDKTLSESQKNIIWQTVVSTR